MSSGYTVPNPNAQAAVINDAFKESGVDPRAISYLEAHGTGTSLGDPIEILGLSKTFQNYTDDTQFCAIGSAKSNIGHCESAAGIAGITKVLLQMKYQQIVPSLHSTELNTNIDFSASPFVVQQELSDWKRPVVEQDGIAKEYPRYAGISSFGAGGANAHILLEEYVPAQTQQKVQGPAMVVLSAKDEDRLIAYANRFLQALSAPEYWELQNIQLSDIAYTLQTGREHMPARLAFVADSIATVRARLETFLKGDSGVFVGTANMKKANAANQMVAQLLAEWDTVQKQDELLQHWVAGARVDWQKLYQNTSPRKISLPTYPFYQDRYWIGEVHDHGVISNGTGQAIYPLLHQNESDLTGHRFSTFFTGEEFFLRDHLVKGKKILPAAASLEMVREAIWQMVKSLGFTSSAIQIENNHWIQPVVATSEGVEVSVALELQENERLSFEVYVEDGLAADSRDICYQGTASLGELTPLTISAKEIESFKNECQSQVINKDQAYQKFAEAGFGYGPAHQGIESIYVGENQLLAKLALPTEANELGALMLNPAIVDAALQSTLFWNAEDGEIAMFLPIGIGRVEIYSAVSKNVWVLVESAGHDTDSSERSLNLTLVDAQGNVQLKLAGVLLKAVSAAEPVLGASQQFETLLLTPSWQKVDSSGVPNSFDRHIILDPTAILTSDIAQLLPEAEVIKPALSNFTDFSISVFEMVQSILMEKGKTKTLVQVVTEAEGQSGLFTAISGLLKTAEKENPKLKGQVITIKASDSEASIAQKVKQAGEAPNYSEFRFESEELQAKSWSFSESNLSTEAVLPWKDRGVYLITGGTGGLGFIFASDIAKKAGYPTLVLTGRSRLDEGKRA
ncbi:MAG: polyketide synthase dehydratase domain-containing protein, partial [Bacteroidota bacterium]